MLPADEATAGLWDGIRAEKASSDGLRPAGGLGDAKRETDDEDDEDEDEDEEGVEKDEGEEPTGRGGTAMGLSDCLCVAGDWDDDDDDDGGVLACI